MEEETNSTSSAPQMNATKANHSTTQPNKGTKRKWENERNHYEKKSKNSRTKNQIRNEILENKRGFLVTTDPIHEKKCVREIISIFETYREQLYSDEKEESFQHLSIEKQLEREIEMLKNEQKSPDFRVHSTGCKGVIFVELVPPDVDPISFLHAIFEDIRATQLARTRYAHRIIPIMKTCFANYPAIERVAKELVDPEFNTLRVFKRYRVDCKRSLNFTTETREIKKKIGKLLKPWNLLDFKNPDSIIHVDVVKDICYITVVQSHLNFKKFSIRALTDISGHESEGSGKENTEPNETKEDVEEDSESEEDITNLETTTFE